MNTVYYFIYIYCKICYFDFTIIIMQQRTHVSANEAPKDRRILVSFSVMMY